VHGASAKAWKSPLILTAVKEQPQLHQVGEISRALEPRIRAQDSALHDSLVVALRRPNAVLL
jgi:hypothetical protein